MLLDELIEVIDTLKQRISDHGPTLRENETPVSYTHLTLPTKRIV